MHAEDLYRILETTAPIIIFLLGNRMVAKKEQDVRHLQNTLKLDALLKEREQFEPHDHECPADGKDGALTYEGIRRQPRGIKPLM